MRPSRLGLYADLQPIADQAIAAGGGSYTLATHGDAVHWRQRFYRFRKEYRRLYGPSKYDAVVLRRIPPESSEVTIEVLQATGVFTPFQVQEDSLDAAALAVAKKVL